MCKVVGLHEDVRRQLHSQPLIINDYDGTRARFVDAVNFTRPQNFHSLLVHIFFLFSSFFYINLTSEDTHSIRLNFKHRGVVKCKLLFTRA